jgi:hypothetical protein
MAQNMLYLKYRFLICGQDVQHNVLRQLLQTSTTSWAFFGSVSNIYIEPQTGEYENVY